MKFVAPRRILRQPAATDPTPSTPAPTAPAPTAPVPTAPAPSAPAPTAPAATALPVSVVVASTLSATPAVAQNARAVIPATGGHRYNVRPRRAVCYAEIHEPDFDEFIWCQECEDYVYEYCSLHLPLAVLPDDEVPEKLDHFKLSRAELSLPTTFLHIAPSSIPGAGLGVFPTLPMPKGVRFGPYCGEVQPDTSNSPYSWQVLGTGKTKTHLLNAEDPNKSNWMRYVNCSRNWHEQNLVPFQYQGSIYYRTVKNIPLGRELLVFYGTEYAQQLNIDLLMYNAPGSRQTGASHLHVTTIATTLAYT